MKSPIYKPVVPCKESPDGICTWLCEDFEDDSWDLYCQYCFRWKDWEEEEPSGQIHVIRFGEEK